MLRKSIYVLLFAALWVSILAIVQFFLQRSVGGLLYFFGERSFSAQTPGIANASLSGSLVLRPYATFPHPNVLGGFLAAVITVTIYWGLHPILQKKDMNKNALFILGGIFLSLMALLLSMSRSAILAFFLVMMFYVLRMKTMRKNILTGGIILLLISALVLILFDLSPRFLELKITDESVVSRITQIAQAMRTIDSYPLFGVGLQNYLIQLGKMESKYQILQPVHNVFFLVWSEMGIVGVLCMVIFFVWLFKRIKDDPFLVREGKFALFFLIIFLGMFDHYLYTLHQGRMLLSLLIAFIISRFSLKRLKI
jgi:O-antigen ligase